MSDTYISQVTSIEPDPTAIHRCGAVSYKCEVEASMYDGAYWCPTCKVFWAIDEDCWHDKNTVWAVEMPKGEPETTPQPYFLMCYTIIDGEHEYMSYRLIEADGQAEAEQKANKFLDEFWNEGEDIEMVSEHQRYNPGTCTASRFESLRQLNDLNDLVTRLKV